MQKILNSKARGFPDNEAFSNELSLVFSATLSNYGRDAGWFVEHRGRRVAELTDPRFADMFWSSYRVEPLTEDPAEREALLTSPDRWLACEFVDRNRRFGLVAENAFPAGGVFPEPGRILMRALYLNIDSPSVWERLLLWVRGSRAAA